MGFDLTGIGSIADLAKGLVDRFLPPAMTGAEKAQAQLQMQEILEKREIEVEKTVRAEMEAKERIIVAELQQSDLFTKRARPSILYAGLVFIGLNHVISPVVAAFSNVQIPALSLPSEFWYSWSAICMTYSIGRSTEKRGIKNKVTSFITGS